VSEEAVADTPEGMVLRQIPAASEPVPGGAIELTVSKRPRPTADTMHAPIVPSSPTAPTAPAAGTNPPHGTAPTPGTTATPEPGKTPAPAARVAPNVVGRIEADAFVALRDASLGYQVDFEDVAPERAGRVLRQDPPPTTPIGEGIRVALTIGRARATPRPSVSTVPPRAGTTTMTPVVNSSLPPPGRHSRSGPATPSARSTSATGVPLIPPPPPSPTPTSPATATLAIRPTSETVSVPDLGGRDATEAVEVALRAGLVPTIVADLDARGQVGRVRLQMPAAGSPARVGSSVSLHVGARTSASMVDVPDVIGLPSGDAAARLAASGFATQLIRSNAKPGLFANPDQIVGQTPVGRFSADAAQVVRIFLP
jgi:beta-lactam-binding protein with PASTA domain